jgi:3-oxosteroid 1-dehydrogenase
MLVFCYHGYDNKRTDRDTGNNMSHKWDYEVDYLVAGTGAAGLSAAITARRNGLNTLVIESMPKWGGTTARSGGGLWMPANPLMQRDGEDDSIEVAFHYMKEVVGEPGPWSNDARKRAFLTGIHHFVTMIEEEGVKWHRTNPYPDYYPDLPGGRTTRGIEVKAFNVRKLGKYRKLVMPGGIPAAMYSNEMNWLSRAWSSPDGFYHGALFVFRNLWGLVTGRQLVGMGQGLASALMWITLKHETPVWLSSPLKDLVVEDGRVVGAIVEKKGKQVRVKTKRGVMLAAGGFAHNKEWRMKYQGIPGWSASPQGQLGQGIEAGAKVGGELAMMEDAWWGATMASVNDNDEYSFLLSERSDPFSLIVDQIGNRFLNESESYVDIGHHILKHNKETDGKAIPSWLVTDKRHTQKFLNTTTLIPGVKKKFLEKGEIVQADTLPELARKMGVDKEAFLDTIHRFNQFAIDGVDQDFQRGRTVYDNFYSLPSHKPNPNLGTIEKGPFTAYKIYPADLNTKGGLVTDEHARVLRKDGSVIEGLYAAGNNTASVMGHTYAGAGSTLGPATVFGFLGALHAAQPAWRKEVIDGKDLSA